MINFSNCSEEELWEYVAIHLAKNGVNNVLVGGAVAAVYSKGAYKSGDLDIVIESYNISNSHIAQLMEDLDFYKKGRHWIHDKCTHLYVEFVLPPVAIGDDYNIKPLIIDKGGIKISILSPVDCVKDRLASYLYFSARECLDQAILVADEEKIDLNNVKKWCKKEGPKALEVFEEFKSRLK